MEGIDENREIKATINSLIEQIRALEAENMALRAKIEELEKRQKLNSSNSHKPPSTDGLSKKPGLPKEAAKKSGGQVGHKGNTLKMVQEADKVVVHHAAKCDTCGKQFCAEDVQEITQKRQVFDIPEPKMEVTEHQLGVIRCCGCKYEGEFPAAVSQPVQYGARIKGLGTLMSNDYKVPLKKIEQLMQDLWGCSFNESTVVNANAGMYEALTAVEETIKTGLLGSKVAHFDETGLRVAQKLHWMHVAATDKFTYLFIHPKRGKTALNSEQSVLKTFKQVAIHDCWSSYFDFEGCEHRLCGAHLLRELTNLIEAGSVWATQMHQLILDLYRASERACVVVPERQTWEDKFKVICEVAHTQEPLAQPNERGRSKQSKGRNLLDRLVKHRDKWLGFAFEQPVPFSNNQAERDIRCVKTKQKVATNFQTVKGAEHYARIQSFISTLRKHSRNVFTGLVSIFEGKFVGFQSA